MVTKKRTRSPKKIKPKSGQVTFAPGKPFALVSGEVGVKPNKQASPRVQRIGKMIKAYLDAGHALLANQYKQVLEMAPRHLAEPSRVLVFCCANGVIVRYESSDDDEDHVVVAWSRDTIEVVARGISEQVVFCVPEGTKAEEIDTSSSPQLKFYTVNPANGEEVVFVTLRITYICPLPKTRNKPTTPRGKPCRLFGVENRINVEMVCQQRDAAHPDKPGPKFLTRSPVRVPVGWEYMEIFPDLAKEHWDVEFAPSWAESDILNRVMNQQLRSQGLRDLDPNVDARRHWARLFEEYQAILESDPQEEVLQQFLTNNPALLSPTHKRVLPKVAFGDRTSDFVFQDATGEYLLVEIERPSKRLFIKSGDTSSHLNHAQNQVSDWKRYIEDNLDTVRRELGLDGISPNPKSLIVIGRDARVSEKGRRKLATMRSNNPGESIMTYDEVLENARAVIENVLGPLLAATGPAEVYLLPETPLATGK